MNFPSFNGFQLKCIAIFAMTIDHLACWFTLAGTPMYAYTHIPGRIAAPIMCYVIAKGYYYTSNVSNYSKRLILFAILSHVPYVMFFNMVWYQSTSVFWGLALGLISLRLYFSEHSSLFKVIAIAACMLLNIRGDWSIISVLWILNFGVFYKDKRKAIFGFILIALGIYLLPKLLIDGYMYGYRLGILLAIPLILADNGEQGHAAPWIKQGFYYFYPMHLSIFYVLRYWVFP